EQSTEQSTEQAFASKNAVSAPPDLHNQSAVDRAVGILGDSSSDISAQISGNIPTDCSDQTLGKISIEASGCLGQCGNGPMVLVLPDQVWYCRVQPEEVAAVVERHLRHGHPIQTMRYYPV
ncbi:MAG TPA: (2Fe-2S) ferredoxin domain-containing protein, partial [Chroococcidiopsis sp.]